MPEETLNQHKSVSRPFAIGIGATEIMYLLGLTLLAAGIGLVYGAAWSLVVAGAVLLVTAFHNDRAIQKGNE